MNFEERLQQQVALMSKWGLEAAKRTPEAEYLDEMKKTVLSEEMLKCEANLSLGEREARARVSEAYRLHLQGLKEAKHLSLVARAKYEVARASWESVRSLCSLEKMHMKTFESSDVNQQGG